MVPDDYMLTWEEASPMILSVNNQISSLSAYNIDVSKPEYQKISLMYMFN